MKGLYITDTQFFQVNQFHLCNTEKIIHVY